MVARGAPASLQVCVILILINQTANAKIKNVLLFSQKEPAQENCYLKLII